MADWGRGLALMGESLAKSAGMAFLENQRSTLEKEKLQLVAEMSAAERQKDRDATAAENEKQRAADKPYKDAQIESLRSGVALAARKANREEEAGAGVSAIMSGGGRSTSNDYAERISSLEGGTKKGGMVNNELGSGAFGPYQFMKETWADVRKNHQDLNLPEDMRQASKEQHKAAFDRFTADNASALNKNGIEATPANLYLAHRFGAGGAAKLINADGNARLADVLPPEWQKQNPDMRGQTVDGFKRLAEERMKGVTMDGGGKASTDSMPAEMRASLAALAKADPKAAAELRMRWDEHRQAEAYNTKAAGKIQIGEGGVAYVINSVTKVAEPLTIDGQVLKFRDPEVAKAQTELVRSLSSRLSEVSRSYMPEILAKEATVRALEKDPMLMADKEKQRELTEAKTQVKALRTSFDKERAPIINRLDALGVELTEKAGLKSGPSAPTGQFDLNKYLKEVTPTTAAGPKQPFPTGTPLMLGGP